jgi:hypothetical protein
VEKSFFQTQLEELFLIGLADDLQSVELPLPESLQHPVGMRFNQDQIHGS